MSHFSNSALDTQFNLGIFWIKNKQQLKSYLILKTLNKLTFECYFFKRWHYFEAKINSLSYYTQILVKKFKLALERTIKKSKWNFKLVIKWWNKIMNFYRKLLLHNRRTMFKLEICLGKYENFHFQSFIPNKWGISQGILNW